jgi:hypothetical protein
MPIIDTLKKVVKGKSIPYTYKVGEASSKPLPVAVRLSMDKDFKQAVTKWVTIGSLAVGLGIATGIVISKNKK